MIKLTEWVMDFHIKNGRWPNLREVAENFQEIGTIKKLSSSVQFPQEIIVKPTERESNGKTNLKQ